MSRRIQSYVMILLSILLLVQCTGHTRAESGTPGSDGNPAFICEFPIEIASNKPWVQAHINDSGPLWFILDTGSAQTSIIEYTRAVNLGLDIKDETEIYTGAGEGIRVRAGGASGVDYDVHGEKLIDQYSMVVELDHVARVEGRQFDGTLGSNFFQRYVIEIDFPNEIIRLYDPASYRYSGKGAVVPFMLFGGLPVVQAIVTIPGRGAVMGNFVVDTGTRMAILFNTPFTAMHNIAGSGMPLLSGTVGRGVGGDVKGMVGRIDSMQIGNLLVNEPVAVFSQDKSGVVASSSFDGIIGGGLLGRCKIIFDYSRRQIIFEPVTKSPPPYEYDMSGLFLSAEGENFNVFTVLSVMAGTPAEESGLQVGDIITAIDRSDAVNFTLEQIRRMFIEDGREYVIDVHRNGEEFQVVLALRRLV